MSGAPPHTRIAPPGRWPTLGLGELWSYRELLYFLVWRDVKVRYKQTLLGALWAVLQPLLTMVVFTLLFHRLAGLETDGHSPSLFYYSGLLPWTLFASGVTQASGSLVASASMLRKVYFPRLLLPAAAVATSLVDFLLAFLVLLGMLAFSMEGWRVTLLIAPIFVLLAWLAAFSVGVWFAAFNVRFRDVRYVLPFLVQLWLFVTPVILPAPAMVQGLERAGLPGALLGLNPVAGPVAGFRWAVLGGEAPWGLVAASLASTLVILASGILVFRRFEDTFADVV